MKGSSVDRSVLSKTDVEEISQGLINKIEERHKKNILKDNDFKALGYSLKLNKKDAFMLQNNIANDSEFLKGYNLTDYSILLTIHTYNEIDYQRLGTNYRLYKSIDNKLLYNLSIIDFFCVIYINKRHIILPKLLKKEVNILEDI
jgi:hypothetical protein